MAFDIETAIWQAGGPAPRRIQDDPAMARFLNLADELDDGGLIPLEDVMAFDRAIYELIGKVTNAVDKILEDTQTRASALDEEGETYAADKVLETFEALEALRDLVNECPEWDGFKS